MTVNSALKSQVIRASQLAPIFTVGSSTASIQFMGFRFEPAAVSLSVCVGQGYVNYQLRLKSGQILLTF